MRQFCVFLMGILPFLLSAQEKCVFFDEMVELQVEKTNLNTVQSDFGPAFVGDELWFSSYTDEEILKMKLGSKKEFYYNLFSVPCDENGNVIDATKTLHLEEESNGYHVGPVSYCPTTGELFVTLSNYEEPEVENKVYQKAKIRLKVIVAQKIDGVWRKVSELPYNNPKYSVGHPSISFTGDTLFFVSDMPGKGYGGTDIYMAIRKNGKWQEMKNMGEKINTSKNEMTPFFYNGRLLIFASNGHTKRQGLDLFSVGLMGDRMTDVAEIKALNTGSDDLGFVIHPNMEVGYFASNRGGGEGADDIYKVIITPIFRLELFVVDKKSHNIMKNVPVSFGDEKMVLKKGLLEKRLEKESTYSITTLLDGYMNDSRVITTVGMPYGLIRDTLWVEKVEVGQKFVMKNIYYDFDKWNILPESEIELNKLVKVLKDNPSWKVELGSHTDCRGTDEYNERLSQKRSESAVSYIVSQGISPDRIIAKGYGESQLVNQCDDGVPCTEDQHRQNRRTEFKILEM